MSLFLALVDNSFIDTNELVLPGHYIFFPRVILYTFFLFWLIYGGLGFGVLGLGPYFGFLGLGF